MTPKHSCLLWAPQFEGSLEAIEAARRIPIQIRTDTCGGYIEVPNLDEVHREYQEAVASLFDVVASAEDADESERAMQEKFARSYMTPEVVESVLFKYVGLYFDIYGGLFEYGRPEEFSDYGPNPFGGDPFPVTITYALETYDAGCGLIVKTGEFDPGETRRIMIETFEKLAAEVGGDPPTDADIPEFQIEDYVETFFCEDDPWVKSVKWIRTSTTGDASQVDKVELTARE